MIHLGLIGYPLTHSKSPRLHQEIALLNHIEIKYDLYPLNDISEVKTLIKQLKEGLIKGFNVTIPYKESVISYVDQLTDIAKKIKAVNTVYIKDGKIIGDNTDYDGFKYLFESFHDKSYQEIAILGTGGAALACYHVLKDLGYHPLMVSRNKVMASNQVFDQVLSYEDLYKRHVDLIINATPIGMYPKVDQSPLELYYVQDKAVIDLIYNPDITLMMKHAKRAINGLGMLIVQGIVAQSRFIDKTSDLDLYIKQLKGVNL